MTSRYEIRAAVSHVSVKLGTWTIYSFPFRIGHHFFLLVEIQDTGQENILEAIHGLATQHNVDQANGEHSSIASPLGTWNSQSKAYCIPYPRKAKNAVVENVMSEWIKPYRQDYWIEPHETYSIYGQRFGEHDACDKWNQVIRFIEILNDANLRYSFCGVGRTLGLNCRNSNSIYATIAQYIGLKLHRFPGYRAPGLDTRIVWNDNHKEMLYGKKI